jgi:hypothetical protein
MAELQRIADDLERTDRNIMKYKITFIGGAEKTVEADDVGFCGPNAVAAMDSGGRTIAMFTNILSVERLECCGGSGTETLNTFGGVVPAPTTTDPANIAAGDSPEAAQPS